ncbi:hypothetical protein Tco_1513716 [Tanacetum coccineum]
MALPLSPDHAAYFPEIMSAQPELTSVVPDLAPLSPNHVFDFPEGNPDEDPKEEPIKEEHEEEEPKEDEPKEEPEDAMGSPNAPLPESDTSSYSESETYPATTVGTITQMPPTRRRFPGSAHVVGGPSFDAPIAYHPEELVPSTLRRDIDSLRAQGGYTRIPGEQDRVREENKRMRKKLEFYGDMIRSEAIKERPSEAIDVLVVGDPTSRATRITS